MFMLIGCHSFAQSYVDLGLPSGTQWKENNESGFYDYDVALGAFGEKLPTIEQWQELMSLCQWNWTGKGYRVTGPNGKTIFLPAAGGRDCDGVISRVGSSGDYWSFNHVKNEPDKPFVYGFTTSRPMCGGWTSSCNGCSVRLVLD